MFYVNDRFGIKSIFRKYLGLEKLVIPGEVQHGYWSEKNWITYIEKRAHFTTMFLWGGEIEKILSREKNRRIEYIGDPWFYLDFTQLQNNAVIKHEIQVIPQYQKQMTREQIFNGHKSFIKECRSIFDFVGFVSLHPAEPRSQEVIDLYHENGFTLERAISLSDSDFLQKKAAIYMASQLIVSNYLGPHVFRASSLDVPVALISPITSDSSKSHLEIFDIFAPDNIGTKTLESQKALSRSKLGFKNVLTKHELAALFHTSPLQQALLHKLCTAKEAPLKIRHLLKPRSVLLANDEIKSRYDCPHCYSLIERKTSRRAFCEKCWARFHVS
jgi:hypothetical protein